MGKAQRYTMEQIQAAQKSLRGLAVKNAGKTRAETVEFLAADIRKAVEQGYSLNEIRDTLAKAGISAPLSRMKALLGQGEGGSGANGRGYAEIPGKPEPESMVTAQADTAVTTDLPGGKKCSYF